MAQTFGRHFALATCGVFLSFYGLTTYLCVIAEPLRQVGIPPPYWFGSDYVDGRGAAVSFSGELSLLGLLYYTAGRKLNRHFGFLTRFEAFCLCNPFSTAVGLLTSRFLMLNRVTFEFSAGVLFLFWTGWPVICHLAFLGFHQTKWNRAIAALSIYTIASLLLAILWVYHTHAII